MTRSVWRTVLVAMCGSALLLACNGGADTSDPQAEEADLTAAMASGTGTIQGKDPRYKEAAAMALTRIKDDRGNVKLSGVSVQLSSGTGTCSTFQKKVNKLELHVQNNEGELPGNVFKVGTNETSPQFSGAQVWTTGNDCAAVGEKRRAKSGSVTITHATTQTIKGEYDLDFGGGDKVKGTFEAPTCLKTLLFGSEPVSCL
jgi:hypothetical protein